MNVPGSYQNGYLVPTQTVVTNGHIYKTKQFRSRVAAKIHKRLHDTGMNHLIFWTGEDLESYISQHAHNLEEYINLVSLCMREIGYWTFLRGVPRPTH